MQVRCPTCGAEIATDDRSLTWSVAKCSLCGSLVPVAEPATVQRPDAATLRRSDPSLPVPRPSGVRVEDDGATLRIVRRWFAPQVFYLAFQCIVCFVLLL